MEKLYYTYILSSKQNGTLYVGVTSNIDRRVYEHKEKITAGFTKKYDVTKLVYYEIYNDIYEAIAREKALKKWHRNWKKELIENFNPEWEDLYESLGTLATRNSEAWHHSGLETSN